MANPYGQLNLHGSIVGSAADGTGRRKYSVFWIETGPVITNIFSIKSARQELESQTKQLDVLTNNAGISGGFPQPSLKVSIETLKDVFESNFLGQYKLYKSLLGY
jgi:NAD(P)-dependent dehydrogenase (short-subunit alcohol dehydrogenase family)